MEFDTNKAVKRALKAQKVLLPHEHSLPTLKTPCRARQAVCDDFSDTLYYFLTQLNKKENDK